MYSRLSLSRSCGDYFLQVQINRSANLFALRVIWTCKKVSDAKLWLEKAIKMYFDSDKRFELSRTRDIRVRDSESRLYNKTSQVEQRVFQFQAGQTKYFNIGRNVSIATGSSVSG